MDKQLEQSQPEPKKMTSAECIQILQAMAIGCTEKEAIDFAIKKIKQAKKWKRKARIEWRRGFNDGYDMGWADGQKDVRLKSREYHADPYHDDWAWDIKAVLERMRKVGE